jgi:ActR/RegA family two-component response regulator
MLDEKDADLLVIDGDERTRPAAQSWMHSQGYDGHCLPDGWSAVRFLEAYRPRFAVLDLTTLGDDSLDGLELIRRAPRLRDLSLVVHVAVPEAGGAADGFCAQAFLTRGINWPDMRAEAERFVQ